MHLYPSPVHGDERDGGRSGGGGDHPGKGHQAAPKPRERPFVRVVIGDEGEQRRGQRERHH